MSVEIVAVGDELLLGATADTNSSFIARELFGSGYDLGRVTVVGDRPEALRDAVAAALARAAAVVVTGGLGPTVDDITKEVVAALLGDTLELDAATLEEIRAHFVRRGRSMPEVNVKQALLPRAGRKIPNPVGSAPGVHWSRAGKEIFLLPGVPGEMQAMLVASVLPRLRQVLPVVRQRVATFRTCGAAESDLAQKLSAVVAAHADVRWAFYPSYGGVDVKLRGDVDAERWHGLGDAVRAVLGSVLYGEDAHESLVDVVQRTLVARNWTLAVAESCTGGLLGARLTAISGSSAYFAGGFVTYADAAKRDWLGVAPELLVSHGAVSAEVAAAMARGARQRAGTTLAVAVTGIAGPTGGSDAKPVGLVYLALAAADGTWTRRIQLGVQREINRQVASALAIDLVRRYASGLSVGDPA